ncbi:MAG: Crp/Fnr family transcriptional regulator [Bacteroidetes bacterium]|nr:Crp/Fnr family transcriptional regulator [Bacteroidota bacterium]
MKRLENNLELMGEIGKHTLTAFYPAGTTLSSGNLKALPIVKTGVLKVMQIDESGHHKFLYYVQPGETCVISMLESEVDQPSSIVARVDRDAEIMFVPLEKSRTWMQQYPEWLEFMMTTYYKRFNEVIKAFNSASAEKLETRIMRYLKQRKNVVGQSVVAITHQNMATDLATNRVVISRLLKSLENRGLIKLGRNKIELTEAL